MDGAKCSTKATENARSAIETRSKAGKVQKVTRKLAAYKTSAKPILAQRKTTIKSSTKRVMKTEKKNVKANAEDSSPNNEESAALLLKQLLPNVLRDLLKPLGDKNEQLEVTEQSKLQGENTGTQKQAQSDDPLNRPSTHDNGAVVENKNSAKVDSEIPATNALLQELPTEEQISEVPLDYSIRSNIQNEAASVANEKTQRTAYVPIPLQQFRALHPRNDTPTHQSLNIIPGQQQRFRAPEIVPMPSQVQHGPMFFPRQQHPQKKWTKDVPVFSEQQFAPILHHRNFQSHMPLRHHGFLERSAPQMNIPQWGPTVNIGENAENPSFASSNLHDSSTGYLNRIIVQPKIYAPHVNYLATVQSFHRYQPTHQLTQLWGQKKIMPPQENCPPQQTWMSGVPETVAEDERSEQRLQFEDKKRKSQIRNAKRRAKRFQTIVGVAKEELRRELQTQTSSSAFNIPEGQYWMPKVEGGMPNSSPELMSNNNTYLHPSLLAPEAFPFLRN